MSHYLWKGKDTLVLHCHIQPKARANKIAGLFGERLKIQISAPPVDGKANMHLLAYIAKEFGVAKRQITLVRGQSSRQKTLEILNPQKFPANAQINKN